MGEHRGMYYGQTRDIRRDGGGNALDNDEVQVAGGRRVSRPLPCNPCTLLRHRHGPFEEVAMYGLLYVGAPPAAHPSPHHLIFVPSHV